MNSLVTGATGFLGSYLVEQLVARGDRVRAFCRRPTPELQALGVDIALGDIRDAAAVDEACRNVDTVFHTAAVAGIWGPWELFYETNTLGTRHVVRGCLQQHVERLVFTSSPSVTFDGRDQCGVDESAPYASKWLAHYPHTKALAEQHVLAANGTGGLLTCALRPHLIWGPRDRHLIPRLLDRQRKGQLRRVGDGKNLIDITYVENAAEAHLRAADALGAESRVCGSSYFLSQGEPVNCWKWIDEVLALADLPPVNGSISLGAARVAGGALERVHRVLRLRGEPRMTRFLALQLGRSHYFDVSHARRDFGYEPRVSTAEGMDRLKSWLPLAKPPINR
jgi:nucleoside-diphosphate-sugar epimerase